MDASLSVLEQQQKGERQTEVLRKGSKGGSSGSRTGLSSRIVY